MIELRVEIKKAKDNKVDKSMKGCIGGTKDYIEEEMLEVLKTFDKADSETLRGALVRFCDYKEGKGEDN